MKNELIDLMYTLVQLHFNALKEQSFYAPMFRELNPNSDYFNDGYAQAIIDVCDFARKEIARIINDDNKKETNLQP